MGNEAPVHSAAPTVASSPRSQLCQKPWRGTFWALSREHDSRAGPGVGARRGTQSFCPECVVPGRFLPEGLQCSCGPDWYTVGTKYRSEYYTWFLFIFCFIIPLSLICFSYAQLLGTLRAVSGGQRPGGGGVAPGNSQDENLHCLGELATERGAEAGVIRPNADRGCQPDL